jgi:signal transduction histidine kinase/CheY-like chemotaxis protein
MFRCSVLSYLSNAPKPFTVTCGNLINAFNQINENKHLIDTLEDSVKKRTHELEQANLELAEANRLVLQANKMQLQHFACMSHEIRTPLNCVIGMASVLQQSKLTSMQYEAVEMIVSSGDLLLATINDVLDYSKYETENVNVNLQSSNLQESITLVLNSIVAKANPEQTIQSFFDPTIPEQIYTDSRRLQQILFNLLGNAIKFSPDDGTIKLSIEMISLDSTDERVSGNNTLVTTMTNNEAADNVIVTSEKMRMLRFIVEDNGKGIDESDFKRIFQPFQQASSTAENVYGGTGLGLSITQKIVTALGGTINVASKKSEWSKFTVDIPCHDSPFAIQNISHQVKNYIVHIVGFHGTEKRKAESMLQTFSMDGFFFNTHRDMLNEYHAKPLQTEQFHVCLLHEDYYNEESAIFLSQSITITFGPKFAVNEDRVAYHFRSLEHLLPSHFINHLVRSVQKKKGQTGIQSEASVALLDMDDIMKSYTELRVMIAEDNVVNQKVLTRILNQLNIKNIDIANNGKEACEKEKEKVYDLIFMDQQMPIMGGIAACRKILDRYNDKNVPNLQRPTIVFATAHVSADFETECLNAGGCGFVPKPFNLDIIQQCLQTVYKRRLNFLVDS